METKPESTPEAEPTGLEVLRRPFHPHQISRLPKPTCPLDEWRRLPKAKCKECGGYHATTKTIHLDYVGHAALTARLLEADPNWNWEPVAKDDHGLPILDKDGGMWIKLTVCGVTRLGYGDAQGKTGPNATKERIGDALRNAAMRFGAALDLWHRGDLHQDEHQEEPQKDPEPPQEGPSVRERIKTALAKADTAEAVRGILQGLCDKVMTEPSGERDHLLKLIANHVLALETDRKIDHDAALAITEICKDKQTGLLKEGEETF